MCARTPTSQTPGVGCDERASGAPGLISTASAMLRYQVFVLAHMSVGVFRPPVWIVRFG